MRIELNMVAPKTEEDVKWPDYTGLYFPLGYVTDTWMNMRRHGLLPRDGAFGDQNPRWWTDMQFVNARYNAWLEYLSIIRKQGGDVVEKLLRSGRKRYDTWEDLMGD